MRRKNKDIFLLSSALKPSSSASRKPAISSSPVIQFVRILNRYHWNHQTPLPLHLQKILIAPPSSFPQLPPPQCPLSCLPEWPLAPPPLPPWKWVALTELLGPWSPPAHPSHTAPPKIWILVKDIRFFACQCLRPYLSHLLSLIYKMKQRYFVIFERKIILPTSLSF